jgi:energy-coupling factor transport system permease protein
MTTGDTQTTQSRPRPASRHGHANVATVVFKLLPGTSVLHRMWVGTKLVSLTLLNFAVLLNPTWAQLLAAVVVTVAAIVAARVPWSAVPRLPWWFCATLLIGLGVAALGHGLAHYLQLVALSSVFSILSVVIVWTTTMDDLAAALASLTKPLRRLGLPADEWVVTTALTVRSLPLLVEECRVLIAARRLRPRPARSRVENMPSEVVDLLTTAMASALRRSSDIGEAMTARGGAAAVRTAKPRVGVADLLAILLVLGSSAAAWLVG